jgi:two-component system phosphate regulon sensor histidine kinase PhoR
MPRIQLRLVVALATLVAMVVFGSGLLAMGQLRRQEMARVERSLRERAELVIELVGVIPFEAARSEELTALADRVERAAGARVTLMNADGRVVADSEVRLEDLTRVENHAGRPEMKSALEGRSGFSSRPSATIGRPLLYLALPRGAGKGGGVVRLAVDTVDVEAAVAELRDALVLAGALGLGAAIALSFLLSYLMVRPLAEVRETVGRIARGDLGARVRVRSGDEFAEIAEAINSMGQELGQRVAEITRDREQLRAVLLGMVEGVLVVDADGYIALANQRLRELFDVRGEIEGMLPIEAIRSAQVHDLLRAAAHADEPLSLEFEFEGPPRREIHLHAGGFAIGDAKGVVGVFRDETELRHLEAVRRDFVANVSHEIKTPLTAIRGFAETLLHTSLPEDDVRGYLQIILRHSERLGQLVNDLLELSRIESGRLVLEVMPLDLGVICQNVVLQLQPRFDEREVSVEVDHGDAAPAQGDRQATEQVLENLLDNAAKYSERGSRVQVRVLADAERVRVEVEDEGVGIAEADRARIFERFYRVDRVRSRELGGTGLGLSIVKHLVQSMGGEVSVDSTPGVGSTFAFTLPRSSEPER